MSKYEKSNDKPEKGHNQNLAGQEVLDRTSENEVLKNLDGGRRSFLKKLLISATYVTPAILTLSMRDLEARRRRPTRRSRRSRKRRSRRSRRN